jgi:hypothetical protein
MKAAVRWRRPRLGVVAACLLLSAATVSAQVSVGTVTPSSGSGDPGTTQTFRFSGDDANGPSNIGHMDIILTSTNSSANSCFFVFFPGLNAVYVFDDAAASGRRVCSLCAGRWPLNPVYDGRDPWG